MRVRSLLCAVLALMAYLTAFADSASAIGGVERADNTSPLNSQNKSVTVACPTGKRVTNAGARIEGAVGQVVLDDVRPSADLTTVTVNALEDETGTSEAWSVTAIATCATPPSGLERVSATSPLNSNASRSVVAPCPTGKRVIGTGADVNTFNGQVLLDAVRPDAGLQNVTVEALEDETGNPVQWSVTAYAVCADPQLDLERLPATGSPTSQSPNGVATQCPWGKQLTGAGAEINSPNGQLLMFALDTNATDIFMEVSEDETGNGATWSLTVYAICARGLEPQPVGAFSPSSSSNKSVTVTCPTGKRVTGAGGAIFPATGEPTGDVLIDDIRPNAALTSVTVNALEDETGTTESWSVAANAICVNPPPGLERVSGASPLDSRAKSVSVGCPAGKRALGVGGDVHTFNGQVLLDALRTDPGLTSTTMAATEDENGNPANWALTVYAICAAYPRLERVTADSGLSSTNKGATAQCSGGKQVVGGGGDINSLNGQVALGSLSLALAGPPFVVTGRSAGGVEDETGNPVNWAVVADAVCATP